MDLSKNKRSAMRRPAITTPPSMRRRALYGAQRVMQWTGMGAAWQTLTRPHGAVILMYHSIADQAAAPFVDHRLRIDPPTFDWQMRFLARQRRVVSLTALLDALDAGRPIAPGTVVITFDDGYVDNLTVAAPILARYALPATLYLPTGYIRDAQTQWVDRLYTMFASRTRDTVTLDEGQNWNLADDAASAEAYAALCERLIITPRDRREALLDDLAAQLRPDAQPPRLTMGWQQVRELVREHPTFELGVHTVDHVDMTTLDAAQATAQLADSMDELHRETGVTAAHFSYPYGRHSPMTRPIAAASGLRSAVASGSEYLLGPGCDVLAMARIDAPACRTLFRFQTSGAYPALPRKVLGRA